MNLLVWGKTGKMGKMIIEMAKEDPFWHQVQGIGSHDDYESYLLTPNVVIDFSHPNALDKVLDYVKNRNCPLVIGTTGYNDQQLSAIEKASKEIPLVYATNMSLGMNLLFSMVEKVASVLKDSVDIEVVESHHNRKKDAPSGSANTIVECIEKGLGEKRQHVHGREGQCPRSAGEIGIHSIRGGNIIGRHEASFIHELESITLVHEAYNPSVFAKGALEAAKFSLQSEAGLYNMKDVLGMKDA
ncbi:4-hydroxy-tetrahydrodipicolinate reductase [Tindallia californiensis]|uniref:4-hydroxy-tetrahydrodipicolinate reductase n=1 Tax=Tindallia californiensis TaxID=159292 RepID=A0A1H3IFV9_9FIRM|nr:4-hydroxy-tetrahydrodipicolinate reductase [Tindallia californiensis]SDY26497.1 dihydrodipicolinate reductase [Tindallia californiensis]